MPSVWSRYWEIVLDRKDIVNKIKIYIANLSTLGYYSHCRQYEYVRVLRKTDFCQEQLCGRIGANGRGRNTKEEVYASDSRQEG